VRCPRSAATAATPPSCRCCALNYWRQHSGGGGGGNGGGGGGTATEVARRRRQWRGGVFDLHVPRFCVVPRGPLFYELARGSKRANRPFLSS
jgi:hypothetical protein